MIDFSSPGSLVLLSSSYMSLKVMFKVLTSQLGKNNVSKLVKSQKTKHFCVGLKNYESQTKNIAYFCTISNRWKPEYCRTFSKCIIGQQSRVVIKISSYFIRQKEKVSIIGGSGTVNRRKWESN